MILKSTNPLTGLLRRSPFKPIKEHMELVFSCICMVPILFDALYKEDLPLVRQYAEKIDKLESEADKAKTAFSLNLPTSLLLPVDRKDLLSLINIQDAIADTAEEIGQILIYRDMKVPDELKELLDGLLEGTMEISTDARQMISKLDQLLEAGFGGRHLENVSEIIAGVRKREHSIDNTVHRTRRALFSVEDRLDPVSVMFWYKIIDHLASISDQAENMADRVLLFISK